MALCGSSAKRRIPPAAQRIAIWQMRMTHLVEYTLRSAVFISDIYRKRVLRRYDLAKAIGLDFAGLVHLIEADKHETDVPSGYGHRRLSLHHGTRPTRKNSDTCPL